MLQVVRLDAVPFAAFAAHADFGVVPVGGPTGEDAAHEGGTDAMVAGSECYLTVVARIAGNAFVGIVDDETTVDVELTVVGCELIDTIGRNVDIAFRFSIVVLHVSHVGGNTGQRAESFESTNDGVLH